MEKKEKRFEVVYSQEWGKATVLVDRKTGVNYLFVRNGEGGGLTALLDRDGRPVVSPVLSQYDD